MVAIDSCPRRGLVRLTSSEASRRTSSEMASSAVAASITVRLDPPSSAGRGVCSFVNCRASMVYCNRASLGRIANRDEATPVPVLSRLTLSVEHRPSAGGKGDEVVFLVVLGLAPLAQRCGGGIDQIGDDFDIEWLVDDGVNDGGIEVPQRLRLRGRRNDDDCRQWSLHLPGQVVDELEAVDIRHH